LGRVEGSRRLAGLELAALGRASNRRKPGDDLEAELWGLTARDTIDRIRWAGGPSLVRDLWRRLSGKSKLRCD